MCSPYLELTLTEVKAKWKDTKKKCINNMTKSLNCQADLIKGKHLPNVFTVMASVYSGTTGSDKRRTEPHTCIERPATLVPLCFPLPKCFHFAGQRVVPHFHWIGYRGTRPRATVTFPLLVCDRC